MLQRILEPEVMDTWEEAIAYDAMDFTQVNTQFARDAVALGPRSGSILDAGTGTARIPILLCQMQPEWQVIGIDLSENMLKLAGMNVDRAGFKNCIQLQRADAKTIPYPDNYFDMVVSNSLVHHLPDPMPFLSELGRVLKLGGGVFLRDLVRPPDDRAVDTLVQSIGTDHDDRQVQLFRDSLYAALTVAEVSDMARRAGFAGVKIYPSSDRHWTMARSISPQR